MGPHGTVAATDQAVRDSARARSSMQKFEGIRLPPGPALSPDAPAAACQVRATTQAVPDSLRPESIHHAEKYIDNHEPSVRRSFTLLTGTFGSTWSPLSMAAQPGV